KAVRVADDIIVISKQTETDFTKFYPNVSFSKLHLIHHALDDSFINTYPVTELQDELLKYNLKDKTYILTVSTILPSKGIDALITAFKTFLEANKHLNATLVIAGNKMTPYFKDIDQLTKDLKIPEENILFTEYVTQKEL